MIKLLSKKTQIARGLCVVLGNVGDAVHTILPVKGERTEQYLYNDEIEEMELSSTIVFL